MKNDAKFLTYLPRQEIYFCSAQEFPFPYSSFHSLQWRSIDEILPQPCNEVLSLPAVQFPREAQR
jgi:hypothetical protein